METTLFPLPEKIIPLSGKPFAIRAAAYLIDTIVFYSLSFVVMYMAATAVGVVLYFSGREFQVDEGSSDPLSFIGGMVLMFCYFVIFEWLHGSTPGKLILGIRVVREEGTPCGLGAALVRGLVRYLDGLLFGLVAYFNMKSPLYQRLGDRVAKTLVVSSRDGALEAGREWWWFLIACCLYLLVQVVVDVFLILNMTG